MHNVTRIKYFYTCIAAYKILTQKKENGDKLQGRSLGKCKMAPQAKKVTKESHRYSEWYKTYSFNDRVPLFLIQKFVQENKMKHHYSFICLPIPKPKIVAERYMYVKIQSKKIFFFF